MKEEINVNKLTVHYTAEQIESFHIQFEHMLHEMFMNPEWTSVIGKQKELKVLSYCLYFQYITKEQLVNIGLSPARDVEVEYVFLNRLVNRRFLKSRNLVVGQETIFVYCLTPSGCLQCSRKLEQILKKYNNQYPDFCIQQDAVKFFSSWNQVRDESVNIGHALAARDLNLFLMSQPIRTDYCYRLEKGIGIGKVEFNLKKEGKIDRTDLLLQCDALFQYPLTDRSFYNIYVEQDMQTQRIAVLKKKVSNYLKVRQMTSIDHSPTLLVFSLQTKSLSAAYQKKKDKPIPSKYPIYLNSLELIIWMGKKMSYSLEMVHDVINLYEECRAEESLSLFGQNALDFFIQMEERNPGMSLDEIKQFLKESNERKDRDLAAKKEKQAKQSYQIRKNAIFKGAYEVEGVKEAFLLGLRLCTTPNRNHAEVFPFLLPHIFFEERKIENLVRLYGIISGGNTVYYSPITPTYTSDGFVFCNHYVFNGETSIIMENISDDLGGRERVRHYLKYMSFSIPSILICLIAEGDEMMARQMYLESAYLKNQTNGVPLSYSIQLCFIKYHDFYEQRGLFFFDKTGQKILLPLQI